MYSLLRKDYSPRSGAGGQMYDDRIPPFVALADYQYKEAHRLDDYLNDRDSESNE